MRKALPAALVLLAAASAEAGEVRGRLLLEEKPAGGVTLSALPYEAPLDEARRDARRQPPPKPLATGTSAPDGTFVLAVPPDPSGRGFRLLMTGGGAAPTQNPGVYDASESVDVGDQVLQRAARLAGRVVDQANQPVAGAEVRLVAGSGPFANASDALGVARTTLTGADGMFRFDDARRQNNRIVVEARGYATSEATGLREGALPRPITLGPGFALSGVVRGPDRKPAAGALVRFEGKSESRWIEAGADGAFRLADLPAGNGSLIVDGGDRGLAEVRGLTLPESASQKLQIALAPGAAIEGRVVDARSGNPLPRVKVLVRSGERTAVTRSGGDGRYRVANLLPQRYRVEADDPRYVPYERNGVVVLSGSTEKIDLPLTAGATISGRVVDEEGAPVAGARGSLVRGGEGGFVVFMRGMRGGDRGSFRSAPDGAFKATRLMPGENQSLTVSHQRYESRTLGGLGLPPGGAKGGVTVVLSRGLSLAGVIKDGEGKPVGGAEIQLVQARSFRAGRGGMNLQMNFVAGGPDSWPRATSGSDGRFEFSGLSKGDYSLTARKAGLSDAILDPAKVSEAAEPVELVMNAGASISGVVLDSNGNPAEGYFVQLRAKAQADSPLRGGGPRNATGPDGFFFADGLRAGDAYDLLVLSPDGPGSRQEGVIAPADGITLQVAARGRITGRVVDATNGQPVTDFELSLSPDRSARGGGMVMRIAGPGGRRGRGFGEREQIHADDGSFVLDEVAQGAWEVDVSAKTYQNGRVGGIVIEPGQSKDGVVVKLTRGSAIRGRVVDARSGRGIPDARVNAEVAGGQMRPMMIGILQGAGGLASDADGLFEIDGLSQGRYTVTAEHADFSEASQIVEVKEGLAAIELRLQAGSSLGGVVLSDTRRPLAGANVALQPAGDGGFGRRVMSDSQGVVSDDQGRFRFDHLVAGRYRVVAAVRDRSSSPVDTVVQAGESRDDLQLQLQAGATIRGQVSGLLDTERTNVNVNATGPESYFAATRTSSDGRFELAGAPAGTITLRANAGDVISGTMRSASASVAVPDGQPEVSAEIVFENGFTISGSVTRAGKPVGEATVMANQRGGGSSSSSRTNSSGSFQLEGLRAATYNLNTFSNQGNGRPQEVKVDGDASVDIVIPVARIAGSVVEAASKQPLADASVEIGAATGAGTGGGGGGLFRMGGNTDSNGRFSFEDLEPKEYTLTARRAGFQFEKKTVAASESGAADEIVIELQRGEGIGVVARDGIFGIPLRGLIARVSDAANAPVFNGPVALDSEGRGEIPSVRPGSYTVILDASGYAPVTLPVSVPSASLNVLMTPGGSIEFRAGETTRAQGPVNLVVNDATGRRATLSLFGPPGTVVFSGATHLVENVAPGRYTVTLQGGGQPQSFTVSEGGRTVVDFP